MSRIFYTQVDGQDGCNNVNLSTLVTLGDKILFALKRKKWTQAHLAEKVNIVPHYLNALIKGKKTNPSLDVIERIADALEVNLDYFMRGNVETVALHNSRQVPVISWVRAGSWEDPSDPYEPGVAEEWVSADTPDSQAFALKVTGKSMEPKFVEGDIIIVSPAIEPASGDYAVVKLSGEVTFKRITIYLSRVVLTSLNPAYPPMEIPREQAEKLHILGKVIQKIERF